MPECLTLPFMLPPVSFQGDHRFMEATALRETLLDRGAEERDLQAVTSVNLTAPVLALLERSLLR